MRKIMILVLGAIMQSLVACASAVTIYQHSNYGGGSKQLQPGRYDSKDLGIGNDQLSSIKVQKGFRATVFEHGGFGGATRVYTADCPFTSDFNDKTSSIIVEKLPDETTPVTVYSGKNYAGICQTFKVGKFDQNEVGKIIGGDNTKSVQVAKGYEVILYEQFDFGGKQVKFRADTPDIGTLGDGVSCVEVRKLPDENKVILCDGSDLQGNVKEVDTECVIKAADLGLKQISSLRVPKGFTVIIRDDNNDWGNFEIAISAKKALRKLANIDPVMVTPQTLVVIVKE